ncbi:MAG: hypothetical protein IKU58_01015 [Clostridia bacterium]|nr:hypothetical protein [Clostridia bacterium]
MTILFIGNSYTYYNDMPSLFSRLCGCNGMQHRVLSVTKGGRKLHENLDPADETTVELEAVLRENTFDICVLQEHSVLPITDYDRFSASVKAMMEKVGASRYSLYQTWGRKAGAKFLRDEGLDTRTMAIQLRDAYTKAAETYGTDRAPVGLCFLEIYENHPDIDLYDPDLTHPSYAGSCLSAMTHFRTLFGEMPADLSCFDLPDETKAVFTRVLRAVCGD